MLNEQHLRLPSDLALLQQNPVTSPQLTSNLQTPAKTTFIVTSHADDSGEQLQVVTQNAEALADEETTTLADQSTPIAPAPEGVTSTTQEKSKLECSHCGKKFSKNFDLLQHVRLVRDVIASPTVC